ncbi:MAG: hypothetical protein JWM78_1112 [Verrucomicrobiaceae bacterium]|nr:hypothetical protein [Verrucomicrobiaceae bacterium]
MLSHGVAGIFRQHMSAAGKRIESTDNWVRVDTQLFGITDNQKRDLIDVLKQLNVDDQAAVFDAIDNAVAQNRSESQIEVRTAGVAMRWLRLTIRVQRNNDASYVDGIFRDITVEKRHALELEDLRNHLRQVLEIADAGMFRVAIASTVDNISESEQPVGWDFNTSALYGSKGISLSPAEIFARIHPEDLPALQAAFAPTMYEKNEQLEIEFRALWPDGSVHWILSKSHLEFNASGVPNFITGIQLNITGRKLSEQRIAHMAGHDALTGLPNRALCSETLQRAIAAGNRYGHYFSLMFIDLDRFKTINDTLGHAAGDELIQEMARRFRSVLRASEFVARLGGDEFVVLAQEIYDEESAASVARKLLSVAIAPIMLNGQECRVTASIGISMYPRDGVDEQALMKHADMAMYLAKEEGKNNFQFYSDQIKVQSLERLALETNLREALVRRELSLQYQPKIDLHSGNLTGVEALLRWQNAELGSVAPLRFIPIAEETGLIVAIGKWVLNTACHQGAQWQKSGLAIVPIAVNVSARQFADDHIYDDIVDALQRSGLRPEMLEIELTEGMMMQNVERAVRLLSAIKELGVRIAIDDFGTGYSSLAQIRRFPVDTLKVDRSFVRNIQDDHDGQVITDAIIRMAKMLSLTVVAEGVETQAEANFLRERSCDQIQGYYISKPVDSLALAALLKDL